MKRLAVALLLVFASAAQAAAPTSTGITCNRTSGTAPLSVVCKSNGADTDTTKPFHELESRWDFGDPGAGTWPTGHAKNFAMGPIAAHVFESAGTYTVTRVLSDGTTAIRGTITITVTAADTTFAGTNTVCIANSTATAGAGGCPAGASTPSGTSDFDAALASCKGSGKRCLFRRGDTFDASAQTTLSGITTMHIGSYGSGALPIVSGTSIPIGDGTGILHMSGSDDVRVVGLGFRSDASGVYSAIRGPGGEWDRMLVLDNTFTGFVGRTIYYDPDQTYDPAGHVIAGNTKTITNGAYACFCGGTSFAYLGNTVTSSGSGEPITRFMWLDDSVYAYNVLTVSNMPEGQAKSVVAVRAPDSVTYPGKATNGVVVSDNRITGDGTIGFPIAISGADNTYVYLLTNVIVERNYAYVSSPINSSIIGISGGYITVRNNAGVVAGSGSGGVFLGVLSAGDTGSSAREHYDIFNNTFSTTATNSPIGISLEVNGTAVDEVRIYNNLFHAPNASSPDALDLRSSTNVTGHDGTTNSSDLQMRTVDPQFDGPLTSPAGLRIAADSYAADAGAAVPVAMDDDLLGCRSIAGDLRMGALTPRADAQCRVAK